MKLLRYPAALLMVLLVSFLAPRGAKADSITKMRAQTDLIEVGLEAALDPNFLSDKTAETDLMNAASAYSAGNYDTEVVDLDGVLHSLGLPPLAGGAPSTAPEPSAVLLLACGIMALLLLTGRAKAGAKNFA